MAVRGVVTGVLFYDPNWSSGDIPIYAQQNYFTEGRTIQSTFYTYNAFEISPVSYVKDEVTESFTLTYPATSSNINLVEVSIINRYEVGVVLYRWSDTEGLEDPTNFNLYALSIGSAVGGTSDLTTVTLQVESYSETVNADFPGRKIPWTILSPLSFRG